MENAALKTPTEPEPPVTPAGIWLHSYPEGIAANITVSDDRLLLPLFDKACEKYTDQVAFLSMGKSLTYRQLDEESRAFAGWLQSCGLKKGDRVALMMPNLLQYPVALFGVLRAGCIVVNCNPLYTPRELEYQLKDSGAVAIVVVENFAHTVQQVLQQAASQVAINHIVVTSMGEMLGLAKGTLVNFVVRHVKKLAPPWKLPGSITLTTALNRGRQHGWQVVPCQQDDIAFLQYTSGTTGAGKGAMLTHGNIAANVAQALEWLRFTTREGQELIVTALPLYHIFALTVNMFVFFFLGGRSLLIANPRDMPGFVKTWRRYPVTAITGVNTLFNGLLNNPEFAKLDFSTLRLTLSGGMAAQSSVAERWLQTTGAPMIQAYGLTETSPAVTIGPLDDRPFSGSIGLPLPSTLVSIRDDEGRAVAPGETAEVCVHGPQVMKGYWQRPAETAQVFCPDGAFRTGDIGYMDENGFVFLVDRKKDLIVVSGFNVAPSEVEEVIAMLPGVVEAAAVGVADEHSGEVVKVFVVRQHLSPTKEQLLEHCHKMLTRYKVPKHVEFREQLPHTNVGKILRRVLREEG